MDPTIWGPHLWFFMHTLSFNYPINPTMDDKKNYYNFFYNLTQIIPCIECKNHYIDFFTKNPITNFLINRDKLIEWVTNAHNNVNKLTNKPIWSLDKVFKHYKKIFLEDNKNNKNSYKKYLIIFSLILIIFYINKKNT